MPNDRLNHRLAELASAQTLPEFTRIHRGLEKESLRVDGDGTLAQSPHPERLGSAFTHPLITTDFSEALVEFITPVCTDVEDTLSALDQVHRYAYASLPEGERLWTASMPCVLGEDSDIPVARYGSTNAARMKTVYRVGLGHRYGRKMQTISGIHYNVSLPMTLWPVLAAQDGSTLPLQDYITERYFDLIRNFRRHSWLLVYLFGASPALCKSFLDDRPHQLDEFDGHTLYLPYATALRMGNLGYQSSAQEDLPICYNSLKRYIDTLKDAITRPHPAYEKLGLTRDGEYLQLSTALLQIENEFYSTIRPKRVTRSGEIPLGALRERGVEYLEVRLLDVNPFLPLGMDAGQLRFIDAFLLYCLFSDSPRCDERERKALGENLHKVVNRGREPGLNLDFNGSERSLQDWGRSILDGMRPIVELLDQAHGNGLYRDTLEQAGALLGNADLTPSARVLRAMREHGLSWRDFALAQSNIHAEYFRERPLDADVNRAFQRQARESLRRQAALEAVDQEDFETYLATYYRQYHQL